MLFDLFVSLKFILSKFKAFLSELNPKGFVFVFTETGFEIVFELRRLILGVLGVLFLLVLGAKVKSKLLLVDGVVIGILILLVKSKLLLVLG